MEPSDPLPDADELFLRYFDRWYSPSARKGRTHSATRPDIEGFPELMGRSHVDVCTLSDEDKEIELAQVGRMLTPARGYWKRELKIGEPVDIKWVEAFDAYYDKSLLEALINRSSPKDLGNDYVVMACELGAVLGHVLQQSLPRLEWVAADPYWESALFDSQTGNLVPVFHWAIKKLSSRGIEDRCAAKLQACLRVLEGRTAAD